MQLEFDKNTVKNKVFFQKRWGGGGDGAKQFKLLAYDPIREFSQMQKIADDYNQEIHLTTNHFPRCLQSA